MILLLSVAFAQDPWDTPIEEVKPFDPPTEAAEPVPAVEPPPGAPEITVEAGETAVEVTRDSNQPDSLGTHYTSLGNRLEPDGVGASVGVQHALVVGSDGGVAATQAIVRYAKQGWAGSVHVPFASYRTSAGRATALGNVRIEGFRRIESGGVVQLIGAEVHVPTGRAWTYAHDATSLWPGGGIAAVYQRRQPLGEASLLVRGSLGVVGTPGVAPFPSIYVNASATAGLDTPLPVPGLGAVAEVSVSAWDPSPIDAAGWLRFEPFAGLQLRGGMLLPLGAWAGLAPGGKPGGLREGTLLFDVSVGL